MRKVRNMRRLCGCAAIVLIACIGVAVRIGKYVNEQNAAKREAELRSVRYERAIPIYSAEEGSKVLELLDDQVDTNRMDEAWLQEQKDVNEAFVNKEISWEEYVDWKEERKERSKERPYVNVRVSEQSFM